MQQSNSERAAVAGVGYLREACAPPLLTRPWPYSIPLPVEGRGLSPRSWYIMPKQQQPNGTRGKGRLAPD